MSKPRLRHVLGAALLVVLSACQPEPSPLSLEGRGAVAARAQPLSVAIDLLVKNDQPVARVDEPARGGVALPSGAAFDPATLRVTTPDGTCVPAQVHPLGLGWPDGSLRRVLVQLRASVPALGQASYRLTQSPCAAPAPPYTMSVTEVFKPNEVPIRNEVRVDTGVIAFTVSRVDLRLPNKLWYGGRLVLDEGATLRMSAIRESMATALGTDGASGFNDGRGQVNPALRTFGLRDDVWSAQWAGRLADYAPQLRGPATVTVEESGPLRVVLRVATAAPADAPASGAGTVGLVARIYAYATAARRSRPCPATRRAATCATSRRRGP